jgi:hypothetical protein
MNFFELHKIWPTLLRHAAPQVSYPSPYVDLFELSAPRISPFPLPSETTFVREEFHYQLRPVQPLFKTPSPQPENNPEITATAVGRIFQKSIMRSIPAASLPDSHIRHLLAAVARGGAYTFGGGAGSGVGSGRSLARIALSVVMRGENGLRSYRRCREAR